MFALSIHKLCNLKKLRVLHCSCTSFSDILIVTKIVTYVLLWLLLCEKKSRQLALLLGKSLVISTIGAGAGVIQVVGKKIPVCPVFAYILSYAFRTNFNLIIDLLILFVSSYKIRRIKYFPFENISIKYVLCRNISTRVPSLSLSKRTTRRLPFTIFDEQSSNG